MDCSAFELETSWTQQLHTELSEPYMVSLAAFLSKEREGNTPVYPPSELVFNAFTKTPFSKVKVVIVGQDPYHGPRQAHGLSFSVPHGEPPPPSLKNIYKELNADLNLPVPKHGNLLKWTEQGVLLLNAILTVKQSEPLSHQGKGWEKFTDKVILKLANRDVPLVFLLWGKYAQEKFRNVPANQVNPSHLILTAPHPSPFSAYNGFFGCRHFSKTNQFLMERGLQPINWEI